VEFGVLGPVAARRDGRELLLGGPKQRALLAILLLHANEVISRDGLIEGLWGERPPATAAHTLDNYVSRLRKALGPDRLARRPPGYVLRVDPLELDLDRFEQLRQEAREQLARGRPREAAATLRSALALWRGAALADVLYEPFAALEAERLEERRVSALEERIDADLELGHAADLIPELEQLVRENPFRERPLAQMMLALYQSGRQADALAAFQTGRRHLAEQLGLEPGPALQELQRKILDHDPSLGLRGPRPRVRASRWLSGRRLAAAGAAVAVAAGAAAGIMLGTGGTKASSATAGTHQVIGLRVDSRRSDQRIPVSGAAAALTASAGSLWLADPDAGAVLRLDPAARAVADQIPVGGSPGALATGEGSVWAASVPGDHVARIDPPTGAITQTIPLGTARASALTFGEGSLWIADIVDNAVIEIDPRSGAERSMLTLDFRPTALAVADGSIWVAGYDAGLIAEVAVESGRTVATVHVGNGPSALVVGLGAVWVANTLDSTVSRVDPGSASVVATIPVGSGPGAIAVAGGSVWVANQYSGSVSRIDPMRNAVVDTTPVDGNPTALAATGGTAWVGIRPVVQHRGGTLVLLYSRPISIDPAINVDLLPPVSDSLTRDGLVTYNHVSGPKGIQLVPDLAIGLPNPTDEGRTYTFRLRPGIRYSDGRPLHAADFRRAIERLFRVGSDSRALFDGIQGTASCDPAQCDLSRGIVADDTARTVTFHLRGPDSDFLKNLAEHGLATAVPAGTPFHDTGFHPIPGTGPYKIASASEREIRYVRNPLFGEWSHAAQPDGNPDEIITRFGLTSDQEVRAVREGRADWLADGIPARLLPALRRQAASQLHTGMAIPTTDFFQLNTTLPPFDDVRVRRALNLAIDRRAIVRIYGGIELAAPTCQVLPQGLFGYRRYCPYTRNPTASGTWKAPDVARARRLVAASGTRGTPVTVWGWTDDPTISPRVIRYTADVLRRLGYPTKVRLVTHASLAQPLPGTLAKIQLIAAAWGDTPYGFFATWFSCNGATNHGWFCDPLLDRAIARTQSLKATNPRAAASHWAEIDRELVDRAVWAPFINERAVDFVSARVRNYQSHPYLGILADQLVLQ
jgi:YVTN family beta-propeller protein